MDMKAHAHLEDFINHVVVKCPKCGQKASVYSDPENRAKTRLSCLACGYTKNWKGNSSMSFTGSSPLLSTGMQLGAPVDPFFKLPLWYKTMFRTHELWAYNLNHLQWLKNYIGDPIRERKEGEHGWSNRSIQSRMPKWMLSAKNREGLLKKLNELEKT